MSYAEITYHDRNPIKRFLHHRRLRDAVNLATRVVTSGSIVDYGAGDGELSRRLSRALPNTMIYCYEPVETLRAQAAVNLTGCPNVVVTSSLDALPLGRADAVFCLEVFEHLPRRETYTALTAIDRLLAENGLAVIGVPIEIFAPATVKGLFRMTRRSGSFDARPVNVLRAALGFPPRNRPLGQMPGGYRYHKHHLGFDHRGLRRDLARRFDLERTMCSPIGWLGPWLNSEIAFIARKRPAAEAERYFSTCNRAAKSSVQRSGAGSPSVQGATCSATALRNS